MIAAYLAALLLTGLAVFQLAAAAGAPVGAYCWGGYHAGRLPLRLRVASGLSIVVYALLASVILAAGGVFGAEPADAGQGAIWFVFAFFAVGVVANFASRSGPERRVMGPVALALAGLTLWVAVG